MGNQCGCADDLKEHEIEDSIGIDEEGVTEDFQYHQKYIRKEKIKLDKYDKFYREIAYPMHYI